VAAVLSMADYEGLRGEAVQAFLNLRNEVAHEASTVGLTEAELKNCWKATESAGPSLALVPSPTA
jgi:hypothetical protein